jgi:long-chain fatty acid transport protein
MRKGLLIGAVLSGVAVSFATNGDNLIGLTPASRAMGGIGVGLPVGPVDSVFRNPAWMGLMENKFTVQFGGILFMPKVKGRSAGYVESTSSGTPTYIDTGYISSRSDLFVVPEIGIVHKLSDRLTFGLGAFGVSGMGVDYRDKKGLSQMHTTFQFMRIIPAVAFKVNEMITVSFAPHLAWGSLDMGAVLCADLDGDGAIELDTCWNASGGQYQTLGIGFQVGASLNFGDFLYAGITYQSPVSMKYKNVFDSDNNNIYEDLKLTQPQEIALGIGAAPLNNVRVGLDLRWINWSGADGYKHFGWKDQLVIAVGGEFKPTDRLALRVGWNYGRSPIRGGDKSTTAPSAPNIPDLAAPFSDFGKAWFNLIGFPAIAEHHITLGFGYEFTKTFSVDFSYVRALDKKVEACAAGTSCQVLAGAKMYQDSLSVGLNWRF